MNDIITNGTEIKQRIISEINGANQSIYLAMAWFTDRDIAQSLINAKNRNVFVDVILSSNAQNETVKQMLVEQKITVHAFDTGDERGMMHHKFCLIDNRLSINGSYNYSYNASNNNVENVHISNDNQIFKQLFAEFERLKYNIDHQLPVNTTSNKNTNMEQTQPTHPVDLFSQRLHNLVYLSAQINPEEYRQQGYKKSEESQGSLEIFDAEVSNLIHQIRNYAIDDSISSKKNVLISNINSEYEKVKSDLNTDKQNEFRGIKNTNDLEKKHISDNLLLIRQEKALIETGNSSTGEKGLVHINKEIERNKQEKREIEQNLIIKPLGIEFYLKSFFLMICIFYLSIFFGSALYKVFFEGNIIKTQLLANLTPDNPQLVDANAIIKIFRNYGILFGLISCLIFLFPVTLTNLKLFGSKNKTLNVLCFWIGLVIFDILVSGMVAKNADKIDKLLIGQESTMQFWEVIKLGEFYLIFIFGMLPLFITHILIDNISGAYKNSKKEYVNAEKNHQLQLLEREMIELESEKSVMVNQIKNKEDLIIQSNNKLLELEKELNQHQNEIESKYDDLNKKIKVIYDDYNAKIISGRIFSDVILNSIVYSYKTGYIDYLPQFYANVEVQSRVREIEKIISNYKENK
jgi:hypothetical protein